MFSFILSQFDLFIFLICSISLNQTEDPERSPVSHFDIKFISSRQFVLFQIIAAVIALSAPVDPFGNLGFLRQFHSFHDPFVELIKSGTAEKHDAEIVLFAACPGAGRAVGDTNTAADTQIGISFDFAVHQWKRADRALITVFDALFTAKSVCEVCGQTYGEKDASNHSGPATVTGKRDATCTEEGYTGDTKWECCGAEVEGETIAALGHAWGAWTVTKEATTTEEGVETRVCKNDSTHTETRKIAKKEETKEEETEKKEETKKEVAKTETVSKTTDTQPQTGDESQTVWVFYSFL